MTKIRLRQHKISYCAAQKFLVGFEK